MNQCAPRYCFIFLLLFFNYVPAWTAQPWSDPIVAYCQNAVKYESIDNVFQGSVVLAKVTFDVDIYFEQAEFLYLTDFVVGQQVDASFITKAIEYLAKKNKFSSIQLQTHLTDDGIYLHFILESHWTFKKIKMHRIFQGKARFIHSYLMNRGDVFDRSKHSHSLIKMKELLEQEGYCASRITHTFDYDQKTKEVTVHLSVIKGKRFSFGEMGVTIMGDDDSQDYDDLKKHLVHWLTNSISAQRYKKETINREAIALKKYLGHKGLLQTGLELEEFKDKVNGLVNLTWKITVQHKRETVFFGNNFFSTKELLEKIMTFGRSAWLMPASLLAEEILSSYKQKGFWNATVAGQEEKGRSFFVIQEGPRALIKSVEIQNASFFDASFIRRRCFNKLLQHKYYDSVLYDDAIKVLTNAYVKAGFLLMTVSGHFFEPLEQPNEYKLIVVVEEGMQGYVTSATIQDYVDLHNKGPFKKINDHERVLFDGKIIDEQRAWLISHFQKLGYLHPRIKSTIDMHDHEVSIVWSVDPGDKVQFGKTIISGSSTFSFTTLMHLLDYKQGELWDQEKIRQTFKAIKELDLFESITLAPDYADKNKEKTVIAKIHTDDSYEVRLRAGLELQHVRKYQTFNGLTYKIGGTGLLRNPFDAGDVARLDLDFARSHREVVARYKRPFFFKVPLLCNIQVYSISYDQPGFIGSVNDIYTLAQNGCSFGIERKTKYAEWGLRSGIEGMVTKIKDPLLQQSLIKAIDFQPQLVDQMVPFFFIEPTVMFEYLDNALNPTSGFLTLCSLKSMIPLKKKYRDTLFVKLTFEQSLFLPLGVVVAAFRIRFGHIFYRKLSSIMPSERFYLGGSHSLRGYEMDLAPPLGVFVDEETNEHIVPRGGKSMLNINTELRFPIYKKVGGVIFQDFGILSGDTFENFKPQNFLAATGFGGRFFTPLGPLRFDIGWRWKKQTSLERSYAWFLSFGQAF